MVYGKGYHSLAAAMQVVAFTRVESGSAHVTIGWEADGRKGKGDRAKPGSANRCCIGPLGGLIKKVSYS